MNSEKRFTNRPIGHKYRVFIQDVGRTGYSGFADVVAWVEDEAIKKVRDGLPSRKFVAFRHVRRDLWPDAKTGKLPRRKRLK